MQHSVLYKYTKTKTSILRSYWKKTLQTAQSWYLAHAMLIPYSFCVMIITTLLHWSCRMIIPILVWCVKISSHLLYWCYRQIPIHLVVHTVHVLTAWFAHFMLSSNIDLPLELQTNVRYVMDLEIEVQEGVKFKLNSFISADILLLYLQVFYNCTL